MQITQVSSEGLKSTYRVIIEAADIERQMDTELKQLGARVKIPGFRPGFVPLKVLKARYGKGVKDDVLKAVISDATQRVVQENKLRPALTPDINVEDYKEEGDLKFTLTVETMPEIPDIDYGKINLMREVFGIEESEIEETLVNLAERNPRVKPSEDKKAKAGEGDIVTMDFVGKVDGKAFEGGTAQGFTIEIGSGRLIAGFEDQLIGLKAGDEKQVEVTFPENYFNADLAGKPATFDVKVTGIATKETPEVDEAFAKDRGFADMRALREAVRNQLMKDYEGVVRTRMKKRLFDELEKLASYDLPHGMVDMEFNTIWGRLQQARAQSPQEDLYEGRKEEEVKDEYRNIAERRVRLGILLAELGGREKLQVSRDEISRAVMQQAQQFPGQEQMVFEFYRKNPQRLEELRGPILEEKAVDWILSKVKMEDRNVTTAELTDEEDGEEGGSEKPKAKKPAKKAEAKPAKESAKDEGEPKKKAPAKKKSDKE